MSVASRYGKWLLLPPLAAGLTFTAVRAAEEAGDDTKVEKSEPKHSIEEVMHGAHVAPEGEKSLRDRVLAGDAKPEERQELLDLYISLAENDPPLGELEDWQYRNGAIVLSAAKVMVDREEGLKELEKATNCAACHKGHKPPDEE